MTFFRAAMILLIALMLVACPPPPPPGQPGGPGAPQSQAPAATAATSQESGTTQSSTNREDLPAAFAKFTENVSVRLDGEFVVIETDGVPPHSSPYFAQNDSRYEAYNSSGFRANPNQIEAYQATYRLPLNPQPAGQVTETPLGIMGVALDGVALFNQYAAQRAPLTHEIVSFDQYNGHPQQDGVYHYHLEPTYLTQLFGPEALIGFLLDGFPVYGPQENGSPVSNSDLDEYHGHSHATPEYPDGIYHYHVTREDPYINGVGFYGVQGTVTCNIRCSGFGR